MKQRTPYDGLPFYCDTCGMGLQEVMACEDGDCVMENAEAALDRQRRKREARDEHDLLRAGRAS